MDSLSWIGGITPDLLISRGWAALVTFASIGIALVIFSFSQTYRASVDWLKIRKNLRYFSRMEMRRHAAVKRLLHFLDIIQVAGSGYFLGMTGLLFLYCSPKLSPTLFEFTMYVLIVPTLTISAHYLAYRIRGHRLH